MRTWRGKPAFPRRNWAGSRRAIFIGRRREDWPGRWALGPGTLIELGRDLWCPEPVEVAGLAMFNTAFQDMTVNSYLAYDAKTGQAAAFDTGATAAGMLAFIKERKLGVELILLTHTHPDHVADLSRLEKATGVAAYVSEREEYQGPRPFEAGVVFQMGRLKIETRRTSGHARGGITYVVSGLERQFAVVGDALFAASMGGGAVSFKEALRTNRKEIFSLPDDTVICPGHGPLTTVGEEKKHNPFYPEFQKE